MLPARATSRASSACSRPTWWRTRTAGARRLAFPRPVHGRDKILRLLQGPAASGARLSVTAIRPAEINGQPGAILLDPDGVPVAAVSLDIADGQVQTMHFVSNPEKLEHLRGLVTGPG